MKKFFTLNMLIVVVAMLLTQSVFSQSAAINTDGSSADASAALDIKTTTKGLLIPRLLAFERGTIGSPATGLTVYQTDGVSGYYYNAGTPLSPNWLYMLPANGNGSLLTNLNASSLATGTVATARLGTGTANATTFLRGDGTWATSGGTVTGTGTNNYITKWSNGPGGIIANSLMQDNGTSVSVGLTTPSVIYQLYAYRQQLTVNGDGQASLYGYRTRDSQNDGSGYGQIAANSATTGYNFWGDVYTFGVAGWNYNDYSRCGGTFGANVDGLYWGSLGYRSSGLLNYGVYGSAAYASGAGFAANNEKQGIGGGFFGGVIGSVSRGEVMGQVNSGELFAAYNIGNVYTSGFSADLVNTGTERVAAYAMTSTQLKSYDDGSADLNGSSVFVPFSKVYAGMLSTVPNVTVTAIGSPAQLYIKSIDKTGFTVAVASGSANVKFSWIAIGNRVDAPNVAALPAEIASSKFDNQLSGVLFDDGNKEQSGKPIWWDGQKIRFDKAPEAPKKPKVEIKPSAN
jgi:hypothetical protein